MITSFMSFHVNRSRVEPYSRGRRPLNTPQKMVSYFTKTETWYLSGENCSAHHCLIDGLRKSIQDELPVEWSHDITRSHEVT